MTSNSSVYINDKYSEPMTPQHNFSNNFDLEDPARAMSSYARIMHEHTKKQLNSARRRSESSTSSSTSLQSVNSTES